jgi:hypothetical protein
LIAVVVIGGGGGDGGGGGPVVVVSRSEGEHTLRVFENKVLSWI